MRMKSVWLNSCNIIFAGDSKKTRVIIYDSVRCIETRGQLFSPQRVDIRLTNEVFIQIISTPIESHVCHCQFPTSAVCFFCDKCNVRGAGRFWYSSLMDVTFMKIEWDFWPFAGFRESLEDSVLTSDTHHMGMSQRILFFIQISFLWSNMMSK